MHFEQRVEAKLAFSGFVACAAVDAAPFEQVAERDDGDVIETDDLTMLVDKESDMCVAFELEARKRVKFLEHKRLMLY